MNIASPISSVIPTLDANVLEVLFGCEVPLTLSEVHRRSRRGALTGVRKVLLRLVGEGIVVEVPGGFLLNRAHLAYEGVAQLLGLRTEFARRLTAEIDTWNNKVEMVGVFGSYARREGNSSSDIDLLIVSSREPQDEEIDTLRSAVYSWTGNQAQVMTVQPRDVELLQQRGEKIVDEWRRDLEVLYGNLDCLQGIL